ncbi:hypothetical protein GPECTOR_46g248 [Gonium pectorale]|uniref:Uroporphyrinogen decarboxylase (URO-D) domain-containing protein n=1 Tax=Gonium pectorale TaxID=33097 RepID=A0A150G8J7_GONPE|nr:hypothetical protein GPECTOR_46g248 [Gonium pectorale]|eukprot:KXZ46179.1 hypothetical protein GPECTOR_46g248 [Gonium pectorale]
MAHYYSVTGKINNLLVTGRAWRCVYALAAYIKYQIQAGVQCVQIFDSWGYQLPPRGWSGTFLKRSIASVKAEYPTVPLMLYANGSGGLLERLATTGADVIGVDWTTDMADDGARECPATCRCRAKWTPPPSSRRQ